jgi:hypothetical protein
VKDKRQAGHIAGTLVAADPVNCSDADVARRSDLGQDGHNDPSCHGIVLPVLDVHALMVARVHLSQRVHAEATIGAQALHNG